MCPLSFEPLQWLIIKDCFLWTAKQHNTEEDYAVTKETVFFPNACIIDPEEVYVN
jgi:hypothetical protein